MAHFTLKLLACAGFMERSGEEHVAFDNRQHDHLVGESLLPRPKWMHPGLKHVREVVGLMPLHTEPLPMNIWRLLMDFGATEYSFCHYIIPHFHGTSVFMCITLGCEPSAPTTSEGPA